MCSAMFEVYKNRNILQFAHFLVSQSHLEGVTLVAFYVRH